MQKANLGVVIVFSLSSAMFIARLSGVNIPVVWVLSPFWIPIIIFLLIGIFGLLFFGAKRRKNAI